VARAYGAYGETVSVPDLVRPALARALAHPGPSVVHVRTSLVHISAYQQLPEPAVTAAGEGER
jgi:acetolactate synthase-1/2/3 large subunit